jgi:hypothetical protein
MKTSVAIQAQERLKKVGEYADGTPKTEVEVVVPGAVFEPNDIVEWDNEEDAQRLCERNIAERIRDGAVADKVAEKAGKFIKTHKPPAPKELAGAGK